MLRNQRADKDDYVIATLLPGTLKFGAEEEALRNDLRAWLQAATAPALPSDFEERLHALVGWQALLHRSGFMGVSWPRRYGGRGLGLAAEAVVAEELAAHGMPEIINRLAIYTWAPTILEWGTETQCQRYLPAMLDASEIWCQGFSEPDVGSDLAATRTKARQRGDRFVVNGQKVWTSRAPWSRYGAMLVRTSDEGSKHHGLSILIIDMESDGVTVRPILQMLHEPHFSEVFFDNVEVSVENCLGPIGGGWEVAMSAMGYERGLFVLERQIRLRRRLEDLVRRLEEEGCAADHAVTLGAIASRLEALRAQVYRTIAEQSSGTRVQGGSSIDKLLLTEADQELFAKAYDISGESMGLADDGWAHDLMESRSVSIYSGTSEIQREIIARTMLNLPREGEET